GLDEAPGVEGQAVPEPAGVGVGAGVGEYGAYVAALGRGRRRGPPPDPLEAAVALEGLDLGVGPEGDGRALLDAPDQVTGHAVREPGAPHQQVHVARDPG